MERELLETFEAAKRAADAATEGDPSEAEENRCVDALKRLRKLPVTMKVLVSTQVGKRLRAIAKHPCGKIQSTASELLEHWKNVVIEETSKNNKKNNAVNDVKSPRTEVKVDKSQKPETVKVTRSESMKIERTTTETVKTERVSKSESVKVEKIENGGTIKVEKKPLVPPIVPPKLSSMINCNDPNRNKVREIVAEALSRVAEETPEDLIEEVNACDPIRVAVAVETAMFEKFGNQKMKYRSIMFNLKDNKNQDFRRRVLLGQVKPERIVTLTAEEMASDQRRNENKQIKEKALE
ncbi:hypothetical protein QJS10_CPA03g00908 [Acorus calamus]|uniref:Uncharacterized protein n=1 Tax=Acorus calamus TaxID=4465 RepID=A0AAV9FBV7_ACOCL|nr:hypothetical protein QJS10_CPA03g00908 [Acorus calamus]